MIKKQKKILKNLINLVIGLFSISIIFFLIYLLIYNIKNNNKFFETPVSTILSILIAIIFTYYFVQRNNDKRKQKEIIEKNISKIQKLIYDDEIYNINFQNRLSNSIKIRKINNHLNYLKDYSYQFKFVKEIQFICEKFKEYNESVDIAYDNKSIDQKCLKNIIRILELIDDKLEAIIHIIYYR